MIHLYFYSNKAREDGPDEVRRNELIRSWVNEIDWDCDLHTFFRDEYVDQYTSYAVLAGLSRGDKIKQQFICRRQEKWLIIMGPIFMRIVRKANE